MKRLIVIALFAAGCAAHPVAAPARTPLASAAPPLGAASPSPSPTPVPGPTPKPTVKPKPTLRPPALAFGSLHYDVNACWVSDLPDEGSHLVGGIQVNFALTVKNKGQVKSPTFTITTASTDWFETTPWSYPDNWTYTSGFPTDSRTATLVSPEVLPGKSRTIKWHTMFLTPFDPHYTVTIDERFGQATWSMWTATTIC